MLLGRNKIVSFAVISAVIGFMLAVQFETIKHPEIRDTRDTWELREDLKKQQILEAQLIKEIAGYEEKINKYEAEKSSSKEAVLYETLEELKKLAGLTEVNGPGLILTIKTFNDFNLGQEIHSISPELLKRLLNELNQYEAENISIADQRVINSTVIRDINGITKIDGYPLNQYPIEIKVITNDPERLYNRLKASLILDDFAIENLTIHISKPVQNLSIPAYKNKIEINNMKPIQAEKEEK